MTKRSTAPQTILEYMFKSPSSTPMPILDHQEEEDDTLLIDVENESTSTSLSLSIIRHGRR